MNIESVVVNKESKNKIKNVDKILLTFSVIGLVASAMSLTAQIIKAIR